jgi:hypothetical protein
MDNIINEINITGTLVDASKVKTGIFKKGQSIGKQYVSGEVLVKCILDGEENIIPISLFSSEVTQKGETSKLFEAYSKLPSQVGQRFTFTGAALEEHRYVGSKGEVVRAQRIRGRFVNEAKPAEQDSATFRLNGYVARGLEEKKNKKGETYLFEIVIGQANYRGDSAQMFYLNLPLDAIEHQNAIRKAYTPGLTVSVDGDIRYITEQREIEAEETENLFGTPMKKTVVNTYRYYYIKHATQPLAVGDPNAYTMQDMQSFKEARSAEEAELISNAKSSGAVADNDAPLTNKAASLL